MSLSDAYRSVAEAVKSLGKPFFVRDRTTRIHEIKYLGHRILFKKAGWSGCIVHPPHIQYFVEFEDHTLGNRLTSYLIWVHEPQENNYEAHRRAVISGLGMLASSGDSVNEVDVMAGDYLQRRVRVDPSRKKIRRTATGIYLVSDSLSSFYSEHTIPDVQRPLSKRILQGLVRILFPFTN